MIRVVAGIVSYNPDIRRLSQNINSIKDQVEKVYIVDNASRNIDDIIELISGIPNIYIIRNSENFGIAKALNQMCEEAINDGNDWILTLDQDTICPSDIIEKFLPYTSQSNVGILCPQFMIETQNHKLMDSLINPMEHVELCITSASLNKLDLWDSINGFLEWLFIDCVDYDYCLRVRAKGFDILRINSVIINHLVGDPSIVNLPFGVSISVYNHSSFRNYYIVRNNIYLLRAHWKEIHGFSWMIRFVYFELVKMVFEKKRMQTIGAFFRGLRDGLVININQIDFKNGNELCHKE